MKRPGMNFSRANVTDFAVLIFTNQKVKINLQQNTFAYEA